MALQDLPTRSGFDLALHLIVGLCRFGISFDLNVGVAGLI
jgi:hypothetical protein